MFLQYQVCDIHMPRKSGTSLHVCVSSVLYKFHANALHNLTLSSFRPVLADAMFKTATTAVIYLCPQILLGSNIFSSYPKPV